MNDKINQVIELLLDLNESEVKNLSSHDLHRFESVVRLSSLVAEHEVFMRTINDRNEKLIFGGC